MPNNMMVENSLVVGADAALDRLDYYANWPLDPETGIPVPECWLDTVPCTGCGACDPRED